MSLGKRDMSQERGLYQDRKDVPPVHFATPPPPPPSHHRHQQQHGGHGEPQQLECFSDEVDSRGSAEHKEPASGGAGALVVSSGGGGDGASIELSKKRRGRPPGSKNKPKPPVVITREADPAAAMRPHVIEIPCGCDVADALARFAARRNLGVCVLAGTGAVANVSFRHPMPGGVAGAGAGAPTMTAIVFHGQYEILSISATFLPPAMSAVAPQAAAAAACLSISLAGPHGQVVGGAVVGPLYAASTVVLVAAAFTNPTFHRLPLPADDDDAAVSVSVSLSAGSGGGDPAADEHHRGGGHQHQHHGEQQQHQPPQERHRPLAVRRQAPPHLASASAAQPVEPCGGPPAVPIFAACHPQPQDVIWPPPPPPPPPY